MQYEYVFILLQAEVDLVHRAPTCAWFCFVLLFSVNYHPEGVDLVHGPSVDSACNVNEMLYFSQRTSISCPARHPRYCKI
mmetsp:Transcript_21549/g.59141  ORF Transcript_21549/g.59141 Transcript_21549/m.59141 type:complete len:80 (-) Transcript_21549:508-747(-)